jgi:hypothetical protein
VPTFNYHCRKDRGGCGHRFTARKSIPSKEKVVCASCGTTWLQKKKLPDGSRIPVIEWLKPDVSEFKKPPVASPPPPPPVQSEPELVVVPEVAVAESPRRRDWREVNRA